MIVEPVGSAELPAAANVGEHLLVMIELVPVEERPDLPVVIAAPRDELQARCELVRGEAPDSLLAESPASGGGISSSVPSLGTARRLHPAREQRIEVHAMTVVANQDLAVRAGHA